MFTPGSKLRDHRPLVSLREQYVVLGNEPVLAACNVSVLSSTLYLWPLEFWFLLFYSSLLISRETVKQKNE